MTLVKPKAATREAWQYTGRPDEVVPRWARVYVTYEDGDMWLHRHSGTQQINPGEWLVRNLYGDPEWLTHDQMRKTFDEVVG
jgi:hypothetical protein